MRIEELLLNENYAAQSFYIIDDHGEWRYHELRIRIVALAEKLKCRGVQPLDRVALISENGASFLIGLLGIMAAGAVAVPVDPQIPAAEVVKRIIQCSISGICIAGIRPEKNFSAEEKLPDHCFILSEKNGDWSDVSIKNQSAQFAAIGTGRDIALILFSSGTTGTPKGVMLTHRAIIENIGAIIEYMKPEPADRFYIIKTMVHTATLTGELLTGLRAGAGIIAYHPVAPPATILKRIEIMKPTLLFVNPSILRIMLKVRNVSFDLSSIRLVYTSGAVAEKELLMETEQFFPKAAILNVYGLTEAGPRVTAQRTGEQTQIGSVGKSIKGVSIIVKDPEGRICKNGETGSVFVKSPSLMRGYWNDLDATHVKIIDGWLDTGDLGYTDEDGELFILGRADDVIIRGSHKIDPHRIENAVRKIQGVINCIVFGIPDTIDGQRVVCSIQKEKGTLIEDQKVIAYCRDYLAPYELPQIICEWDEIPLTATGKISRKLARDLYLHQNSFDEKNIS